MGTGTGEDGAIRDLRSALARFEGHPGQVVVTDHPVDPNGELAGVHKRVGAGGTVERPTGIGPAMLLTSVTGCPGARVLVGSWPAGSGRRSCSSRPPGS